jgi:hypothetical protein
MEGLAPYSSDSDATAGVAAPCACSSALVDHSFARVWVPYRFQPVYACSQQADVAIMTCTRCAS